MKSLLLLLVLLAATVPLQAAEQNVRPGVNRSYKNPDIAVWVSRFESPGREVYDQRRKIISALKLRKGMHVADVGAGTGLYTRLFAREVGHKGRVYAVDITPEFIRHIQQQAKQKKLANIRGVINTSKSINLPPASVNLIFVCATYHHFEYPKTILKTMHRALRPGGQLVIIDFRKQKGVSSTWVMQHVRADKQQVIREVTGSGFRLSEDRSILKRNYYLRFKKQ